MVRKEQLEKIGDDILDILWKKILSLSLVGLGFHTWNVNHNKSNRQSLGTLLYFIKMAKLNFPYLLKFSIFLEIIFQQVLIVELPNNFSVSRFLFTFLYSMKKGSPKSQEWKY